MEKMYFKSHYSDPLERLKTLNWDYEGDRSDSKFSALHFYPGRLISQIPAALIGSLTVAGDLVVDPYCGSGTTLVEAQKLGRRAIGIDVNPVSIMIAKAKTQSVRATRLTAIIEGHLKRIVYIRLENSSAVQFTTVPEGVQKQKWYHPETLNELALLWSYIITTRGITRTILEFCFSSILVSSCNETRHWGYICDNTRPLELRRVNAFALFEGAASELINAYRERDLRLSRLPERILKPKLFCEDSAICLGHLEQDSVSLVVCSPPYFGVVDYVKSQRLTMEWFGLDINNFRKMETGARSKRARISAFDEYIAEMKKTFVQVQRVLKNGGYCCVVLGQSKSRRKTIPILIEVFEKIGLRVQLNVLRDVASGRRQTPHINDEHLLIFEKRI